MVYVDVLYNLSQISINKKMELIRLGQYARQCETVKTLNWAILRMCKWLDINVDAHAECMNEFEICGQWQKSLLIHGDAFSFHLTPNTLEQMPSDT